MNAERCPICGGAVYREDHDSPLRHVNLEDWAASPHDVPEALPEPEPELGE